MRARRDVLAATVAGFVFRAWFVGGMSSPFMFYDEGSGPTIARLLTGERPEVYGTSGNPLLGVVLAPVAAVLSSPETFYRAALLINAACFSLVLPVLYIFGRDGLAYGHREALIGAILGSTIAPSIAFSTMVVPEALLTLAGATAVVAVDRAVRGGFATRPTVAAVAATVAAFAAHRRGLILVVALALVIVDAVRTGAVARRVGGFVVVALLTAVAAISWFASSLNSIAFVEPPGAGGLDTLIDGLGSPTLAARSLVGTSWYLAASSWGVVPVAVTALIRLSVTRPGPSVHRFVAASCAGTMALSALFVSQVMANDGARVDSFAYGRYVEFLVPVMLAYAPAAWRRRSTLAVGFAGALAAVGVGTVVAARAYDRWFWLGPSAQQNQSGIHWARHLESVLDPSALAPAAIGAVTILAVVSLLIGDPRTMIVIGVVSAVSGATFVLDWAHPASADARNRLAVAEHLRAERAENVAASIDRFDPTTLQLFAFWAPEVDFDPVEEVARLPDDAQWVLQDVGAGPDPERFTLVMVDERSGVTLWRASGVEGAPRDS